MQLNTLSQTRPEVFIMLLEENAGSLPRNVSRAREDSRLLWQYMDHGKAERDRLDLGLTGRYHVGDGSEFPCEVPDLTQHGLRVKGPKIGREGEWFVGHLDAVGVVEGIVVHTREQSFTVGVVGTPRGLRRLSERLTWRLKREAEEVVERRSSERVEMSDAEATLQTDGGQAHGCRVFDVSEGGAALHLGSNALYFWVDQSVAFNGRAARVLRLFPGGVVIKFEES